MTSIIAGLVLVVIAVIAYVAIRNARDFSDANEVIPGVPTSAPKAWAGAHSTEARLHRRLRDAMTALRANRALDAPDLRQIREDLEREALAVDERLVAVAALPRRTKEPRLADVARAVDAVEDAVADVVRLRGPAGAAPDAPGLDAVRTRLTFVEQARAELDAITTAAAPDLDRLRASLEDEPVPEPAPDPATRSDDGQDPEPGSAPG